MSSPTQPIGVIARLLDLTERRVQQLSREGVIPKAERGLCARGDIFKRFIKWRLIRCTNHHVVDSDGHGN